MQDRLTHSELESLEYHGCSSGTPTPPFVRAAIVKACAELRQHRIIDADFNKAYQQGISDCIAKVKERRGYFELYRGPGAMQTKQLVFAILDEMLVFLEAMLERAKAGQ